MHDAFYSNMLKPIYLQTHTAAAYEGLCLEHHYDRQGREASSRDQYEAAYCRDQQNQAWTG